MKKKTILGIVIFIIFIGGAYFAYNALSGEYKPNNDMVDTGSSENKNSPSTDTEETPKPTEDAPEPAKDAPETTEDVPETAAEASETTADEKIKAADFTVTDMDGNEVKLSDFSGQPVVINFWASWCSPCKSEMPHFDKVYNEVKDDVQFLMVNMVDGQRETVDKGKKYIADSGYSFPVFFDTTQDASVAYGVFSIPSTAFIDSDGYFVSGYRGVIDEDTLRNGIESITSKEK